MPPLAADATSAFAATGFLRVPGLMADALDALRTALDEALSDATPDDPNLHYEGPEGYLVRAERLDQRHPAFAALMHETPALSAIAEQLLGPGLQPDSVMLFDKVPGTGRETPPHQDAWFLRDVEAGLHFWIAIDDTDATNGCLQYVHGSHRLGVQPHHALHHPTYSHTVGPAASGPAVPCPATAGDVLIHHVGIVHGAGPNTSPRSRRAISVSFYRPDSPLPAAD